MKKAKQPLIYVLCAVASFLFEYGVLYLLEFFLGGWMGEFVQKVVARALSSFLNFNLNYRFVFPKGEDYGKSMVKYYCLVIPVMLVSATLLDAVARWTRIDEMTASFSKGVASLLHTLINAPVDLLIAICNFLIQKYWVFAKKRR